MTTIVLSLSSSILIFFRFHLFFEVFRFFKNSWSFFCESHRIDLRWLSILYFSVRCQRTSLSDLPSFYNFSYCCYFLLLLRSCNSDRVESGSRRYYVIWCVSLVRNTHWYFFGIIRECIASSLNCILDMIICSQIVYVFLIIFDWRVSLLNITYWHVFVSVRKKKSISCHRCYLSMSNRSHIILVLHMCFDDCPKSFVLFF